MSKNDYKIKQREYLSNIIQKIKNENNYDYSFNNIGGNIKKNNKEKKIIKRNLKLNDSLSKEIQDMTPKNTKSTINYEKILDKYEHPIELNSLANSNKQIKATIDTNKTNNENNEKNDNNEDKDIINQIYNKNKIIENNNNNELINNMKNKICIFIEIMKKYSEIFNNIKNNLFLSDKIKSETNEKLNIKTKAKNELDKIIKQFNKLISNPKLSEMIFMSNNIDNNNINNNQNNFLENKINELIKKKRY